MTDCYGALFKKKQKVYVWTHSLKFVEKARKKYPEQNIKAAKCNDPIIWFKKYKLNQWDQVKD